MQIPVGRYSKVMAIEKNRKGMKNELLLVATVKGETAAVRRLLERNSADINTKNSADLSCLQLAILHKHFKLADYLIQKGIDVHSRDLQGWTALHDAALVDCRALVRKLVWKGCSLTSITHLGELPIDVAGSVRMEKLLCEEMSLKGERTLAEQYIVYLGLQYLRDPRPNESPPLANRQSKWSVTESDQPVATAGSQILDCERVPSHSCPGTINSGYSANLEVDAINNSGSLTRLEEVIDPPTYESGETGINSLLQASRQTCRTQLQAVEEVIDSSAVHNKTNRDVNCCDVLTSLSSSRRRNEAPICTKCSPPVIPRRRVNFADPLMARTNTKTTENQPESKPGHNNSGGNESSDSVNPLGQEIIAQLNKIYQHRHYRETTSSDSDENVDREDAIALLRMKPRRSSIASPERRKSRESRRRSVSFQPEVLLQEMVTDGDAKAVSDVLRKGMIPDVNKMSPAGLTALHQSAIDGNLECAKTLVSNGANVNCTDCEKWTPLHAAAMTGHVELVQFLLQVGASPVMKNEDGETAYDIAKHGPVRKILLCAMNGKSPDADEISDGDYSGEEEEEYSHAESDSEDDLIDENGVESTLFDSTVERKQSLKERLGLNHNENPKDSCLNTTISPPLDFDTSDSVFMSTGGLGKNVEICIPISRRERNLSDSTSSYGSLNEPENERIRELAIDGAHFRNATRHHRTSLPTEELCHTDLDKLSVSEDQGISTMDGSSDCSNRKGTFSEDEGTSRDVLDSELEQGSLDYKFQEACLYCDVDAVLKLLKHKSEIDVNRVNKSSGITALHHAVLEENFALVQHLVKDFEASVHVKDTDGWTPLHAASAVGNIRIAQFLLEGGAKASVLNNSCEFPVDVASDVTMEKLLKNVMLGPSIGKIFKGVFTR